MNLNYYSIWDSKNSPNIQEGVKIKLEDLLKIFNKNFDANAIKSQKSTLLTINDIIYAISGLNLPQEESKEIKGLLQDLRGTEKGTSNGRFLNSPDFLFGCLPYLITGFQFNNSEGSISKDGINTRNNLLSTSKHLAKKRPLSISTFLCAHRGLRSIRPDSLRDKIKIESIEKMTNLISGIVMNSRATNTEVNFYQPENSSLSTYSIFPSILLQYISKGDLADMFLKLEEHNKEFKKFLSKKQNSKISFKTNSFNGHVNSIINEARSRYGDNWKNITNQDLMEDYEEHTKEGELADIIVHMTKKDVERLMDFYSNPIKVNGEERKKNLIRARKISEGKDLEKKVQETISLLNSTMSVYGKAIYETISYYLWGKKAAELRGIGLGFEVDHDRFQTAAWSLGWNEIKGNTTSLGRSAPILYARKNESPKNKGHLKDISFRQFWR